MDDLSVSNQTTKVENRIRFGTRIFLYLGVWLLAVVAFEVFLKPEGLTETPLSPLQQRLQLPLYTPLMVFFGISQVLSTPWDIPQIYFWLVSGSFLVLAVLVLRCARLHMFTALIILHAFVVAVAVVRFIQFSQLPDGP